MVLYLNQEEIQGLVGMDDAIEALETAFGQWSDAATANLPRRRMPLLEASLNVMAGALPGGDIFGYRAYYPLMGYNLLILLSRSAGGPIAHLECGWMSTMRTGAASGIATKYLAREDAKTLAVIGVGRTAGDQLRAVHAVRALASITVFARSRENREAFAEKMSAELGIPVAAAVTAEACVAGADIVTTTTKASEPVLFGDWLSPGVHINGVGANDARRRELDDAAVLGADIVVTDHIEGAKIEAGALIELAAAGKLAWEDVHELGAVVEGTAPGRTGAEQITFFHSQGMAFEDVAFGKLILEKARAAGVGTEVPG